MTKYTDSEVEKIVESVSLLEYFQYLESKGEVKFNKKYGKDYYFISEGSKYSVSNDKFYDFKTGKGGKIIKAVMQLENKKWIDAVEFLKNFGNSTITDSLKKEFIEKRKRIDEDLSKNRSETKIIRSIVPNNQKLIEYFESRGISKDVLKQNVKQIHYQINDKQYFGAGLLNQSGGYEIRNPMMKSKIGTNNFSLIEGKNKNEMLVFEGFVDALSFLQLMKENQKENTRTLVCLNSVTNVDKFIEHNKDFSGKIFLLLDGDDAGNLATKKIEEAFQKVKDIRQLYGIYEEGNNDLNDYLKKKHNLVNKAEYENTKSDTKQQGVSNLNRLAGGTYEQDFRSVSSKSKPKQEIRRNNNRGQDLGSENVGDGLESRDERSDGRRHQGGRKQSLDGTQRRSNEERYSLGRGLITDSTSIVELDKLIAQYKGQKITNEQVTEMVSSACFVSNDKSVHLKKELKITDDLKDLINQYQPGGVTKSGRGVLDEYYTNSKIVNSVRNILNRELQSKNNLSVLEPSVGTGNFLYAVEGFPNTTINTFEVNETTAKISKILHNDINVNLRSFETEFIDDNGFKKDEDKFTNKYDLVIGNPPYGNHRGFYKGLGEEPSLSKYEDYFVKRSLDSLKEGGTLAMVLPSSWLNSQNKFSNGDLITAYRLPVGAFKKTQVGTDIILLKKDSQKQNIDISNYFEKYKSNVLGEVREKTNRFGQLEKYVHGNLEDAIAIINRQIKEEKTIRNGWYLHHNDFSSENNVYDFSGAKVTSKLIKTIESIDKRERKNNHWYNYTFIKYQNGEEEESGYLQIAVGDKFEEQENKKWFAFLSKEIQKPNVEQEQPTLFDITVEQTIEGRALNEIAEKRREAIEKTYSALNELKAKKIKTPSTLKGILKYEELHNQLLNKSKNFNVIELEDLISKSNKIIQSKSKKIEHQVQTHPFLKKGILKYKFHKEDTIEDTSNQNNGDADKDEIEAFRDTNYNGVFNNPDKHKKYANFIDGVWVHDFYYTEGNIYKKLIKLEENFINKNSQYEKQKAILESVLPRKKSLEEIIISPNHEFVHKFNLGMIEKEYVNYKTREKEKKIVTYTLAEKFKDFIEKLPNDAFAGSSVWEIKDYVDNVSVTGSDRERNTLVRERRKKVGNELFSKFKKEELSEKLKERFVEEFNEGYNNINIPDYSKFPLFSKIHTNFKGTPLKMTEVQRAGVGRLITKGVGVLAHEVGFGKTLSGVLSMHEAMERGNTKRPIIIVPNDNILKQWFETIYEVIPHAKVNVLGNLGKDYDLSNFQNQDSEITLITYNGLNNIGFSKKITDNLASKFSYISHNELKSLKNTSERDIHKEIEKENELKGKMRKGKIYDWEDFGFDHLTFDEVHNANHIVAKVKIEDKRFASDFRNQNQRTSSLGISTWMSCQYIQEKYDGRNITLLSATPFTNKPLEYYSILSLVANNRLEEKGYFNVNTFFETFMEADNEMEIDAKGDIKNKSSVKRFKNNTIFKQLLGEFIDIKGEEDNPELIRPNRINKEYKISQNDLTVEQYELLNESLNDEEKGAILTHILNARLIAISPYLSPYYTGAKPKLKDFVENSPKLKITMDLIAQNKKDNPSAGQIIYSELAVNTFSKLKKYLVDEIKFDEKEVALITGQTSKIQRFKIQNDFNEGKIKVIIGSAAIKEGINLQRNTSDMYVLSLPYNFTTLRQVEGRSWRQGNKFENVRINYMLTEDSIDVFMLQKLQDKQARYLEAMKKDVDVVDVSDINTSELKTALITNPKTRAKIEISIEKRRLENQKNKLIADSAFVLRKFDNVIKVKEEISKVQKDITRFQKWEMEGGENKNYWGNQIKKQNIILLETQDKLNAVIDKMRKQGIEVTSIEKNISFTEKKINEIDNKIDKLPLLQHELEVKYIAEKEKIKMSNSSDWVLERENENKTFYKLRDEEDLLTKDNSRKNRR